MSTIRWPHGSLATAAARSRDGYRLASIRMFRRFRGDHPRAPGNSVARSTANRSITAVPHPSSRCRSRISRPIRQ